MAPSRRLQATAATPRQTAPTGELNQVINFDIDHVNTSTLPHEESDFIDEITTTQETLSALMHKKNDKISSLDGYIQLNFSKQIQVI